MDARLRSSIDSELSGAVSRERELRNVDEMKKRAITTAGSYEEFKNLVACANLKPLARDDTARKVAVPSNRVLGLYALEGGAAGAAHASLGGGGSGGGGVGDVLAAADAAERASQAMMHISSSLAPPPPPPSEGGAAPVPVAEERAAAAAAAKGSELPEGALLQQARPVARFGAYGAGGGGAVASAAAAARRVAAAAFSSGMAGAGSGSAGSGATGRGAQPAAARAAVSSVAGAVSPVLSMPAFLGRWNAPADSTPSSASDAMAAAVAATAALKLSGRGSSCAATEASPAAAGADSGSILSVDGASSHVEVGKAAGGMYPPPGGWAPVQTRCSCGSSPAAPGRKRVFGDDNVLALSHYFSLLMRPEMSSAVGEGVAKSKPTDALPAPVVTTAKRFALLSTLVATRPFPLLSLFKFEIDDVLLGEMLACINERMTLCSSALVGLSALDTAREPEGAAFPLEAAVAHAAEGASREKAFGGARDGCSAPPINNEVELRPFLPSCPSCINVTFSSLGNDLQSLILLLQAFPSCGRFRLSTCLLTKSERANASAFAARCLALQTALVETHGRVSPSYALSLPSLSAAFDSWEAAFK